MRMVMDTGSGPSVVQESTLPKGWKTYAAQTGNIPQLADANGNPLRITGRIKLLIQLGRKVLDAEFFVAPKLAVPVILGTSIMNSHVDAIRCRAQRIDVHDGGSIAILLMQNVSKLNNSSSCYVHEPNPSQGTDLDHQSNRIRLAREITIPPMSQLTASVVCAGGGLSLLEAKEKLFHRQRISMSNGIAEIIPRTVFTVILTNFGSTERYLPKGTVVGIARRAPGPADQKLPSELSSSGSNRIISLTNPMTGTKEKENPQWREDVSLEHLQQPQLKEKIIAMLSQHESMWDGSLGDIKATEHRIDIVEGSRPRRQQPYPMGPLRRELAS